MFPSFFFVLSPCQYRFPFAWIKVSDFWIKYFKVNTYSDLYKVSMKKETPWIKDMSNLHLLFDAHVNGKASFTLLIYKIWKCDGKPIDDKPLLFWANNLLSTPLFKCTFVVAFDAKLNRFKWSSSIKSPWALSCCAKWLQLLISSTRR